MRAEDFRSNILGGGCPLSRRPWFIFDLNEEDWVDWHLEESELAELITRWYADCFENGTLYHRAVIPLGRDRTPPPRGWIATLTNHGYETGIYPFERNGIRFYGLSVTIPV